MWSNSFNPDGTVHKEVAGYLTNYGVLVLPNTNNTYNTSDYFYFTKGKKTFYNFNGQILNIYGLVHTHPNGFHDSLSDPYDYQITQDRELPDFVIGKNGTVQLGLFMPLFENISITIGTTADLFNGITSLYNFINK